MQTFHSRELLRFRDFELDVAAYELRRKGRPVKLGRQQMDLLILLVQSPGQLVPRGEIVERLWGKDVFVDVETGVNTAISKIRQALHDSPEAPEFVETVPGKGYRFIAPVEVGSKPPTMERRTAAQHPSPTETTELAHGPAPPAPAVVTSRWRLAVGRLAAGLLAAGLLVGVAVWGWRDAGTPLSRVRLAVLPFENLSGDPDREYLADGLAEETTASLGQVDPERVSVVGRTSMMAYKRTTKSVAEIGRELGTDYLVESTIRAEGGRLRVTCKLIRVRDQIQVWSESYDREPTSMLGLQQELSTAIAQQIRLRLSPDRLHALARRQTRNSDAYDLYLRGQNFANQRTAPTTQRAIEYFQRATSLDPGYALAWAGLAMAYSASPINGDADPLKAGPRARDAARAAVRADPNLAEAQHALGTLNWFFEWDWPAAETAFRRAIALDPHFASAYSSLGHVLSQMGRHTEAEAMMRRARELDPLYAMPYALSAQAAFQAGDYPRAVEYASQAIGLDSEFWIGHMIRAQAYERLGQNDLALEAAAIAARFSGQNSKALSLRGYILAKTGRAEEAREVLKAMETVMRQRYLSPFAVALVYAGLGERDAIVQWLDRAYAAHDVHLMFLTVDPKWDPYRSDPRFIALLARCNFTRTGAPVSSTP
jgi:TolB-like protein/DNA-binding winged helix-turn-helix (wHTH) protein/tetratricopeptide (TPR) repeat protein